MIDSVFEAAGLKVFERGWLSCNNVLFEGGSSGESVLVDSGYHSHGEQTIALVKRVLHSQPLDRIVNTHLHSDHCGGNHALQSVFDCAIDVPIGEASKVDSWDERALSYRVTGQHCPQFRRTGLVEGESDIELGGHRWRVIAAPGHDPESIVLYQPEFEILISADALWENGFGVVFPEIEGQGAFFDVQRTLDLIRNLRVAWIIPGHGAPFSDLHRAVDRAQRRLNKFVGDPELHGLYAAKVLIKFHMLELGQTSTTSLVNWCADTEYLRLIHTAYFLPKTLTAWANEVIQGMIVSGALGTRGASIIDV
jgi:glyoxylase-like metal-dependent hydrolase (beta-lactamase superfamily II)